MRSIALATSSAYAALTDDDRTLVPALAAHGFVAEPAVWNDGRVAWGRFAAVVLRSTWDYHRVPDAFRAWIDGLAARGVPLVNAPDVVRWNLDKRYLHDLARRGADTVATELVPHGSTATLAAVTARTGWPDVVVKPSVSATAYRTWRARAPFTHADDARLAELLADGAALVQPFVPEVVTDGEWSLVFLGGEPSHAVLKRATRGDFRVQADFGGTWSAVEPPPAVLQGARHVLDAMPFDADACAYARVDGVVSGGAFRLMELELVEPALFLASSPGAVERFARAITAAIARGRAT